MDSQNTISYLALEIASNKTLLEYLLKEANDYVEEKWVRYWFRQILAGMIHIRSKNYSHLDIKCENILLDSHLNIKIADFGFAQSNCNGIRGQFGSEFHKSPEQWKGTPYDGEKADVFALSIVLFACQMLDFPVDKEFKCVLDSPKY